MPGYTSSLMRNFLTCVESLMSSLICGNIHFTVEYISLEWISGLNSYIFRFNVFFSFFFSFFAFP